MTYTCRYRNNSMFPYSPKIHKLKKGQPLKSTASDSSKDDFYNRKKFNSLGFLDTILAPVEKMIGRKINFDDIILVALIYLLYTEKDDENTTLLLCLIFILLG